MTDQERLLMAEMLAALKAVSDDTAAFENLDYPDGQKVLRAIAKAEAFREIEPVDAVGEILDEGFCLTSDDTQEFIEELEQRGFIIVRKPIAKAPAAIKPTDDQGTKP